MYSVSSRLSLCVCIFFGFLLNYFGVHGQVCQRISIVTRTKQVPYSYTYTATYRTNCWYGRCTKSRTRLATQYRTISYKTMENIDECCDGYIREDFDTVKGLPVCKPICMPACLNGYCKEPGSCACNDGYISIPNKPHYCVPVCSKGCNYGSCIAPETCRCNFGYHPENGTCQPICSEPCENAKCTAPDTCECLDGYRKSESNVCQPYCSQGCAHGFCDQPESCECNEGYTKIDGKCDPECEDCTNGTCVAPDVCECYSGYELQEGSCEPVCSTPCENGDCIAPDTCDCYEGYSLRNGTCQPICTKDCGMGRCTAPNICECYFGNIAISNCDPYCCRPTCDINCEHGKCIETDVCECDYGYTRDAGDEKCVPECMYNCGNGTCVQPNICKCFDGYQVNESKASFDESICTPICKNCEGDCVAPDTCVCDPLYVTRYETASGEECDCFANCSDITKKCERTVCITKYSTTESATDSTTLASLKPNYGVAIETINYNLTTDTTANMYGYDLTSNTTDITLLHVDQEETEKVEFTTAQIHTRPKKFGGSSTFKNEVIDAFNASSRKLNDNNTKLKQTAEDKQNSYPVWMYAAISIIIVLILVAIILFIMRRRLSKIFRGGSYVVEEQGANPCATSRSIDVRFSPTDGARD